VIDDTDVEGVAGVLREPYITQGPLQSRFEEELAAYCGARFGVAFPNGSIALQMAATASGLGSGDVAITSPITFVATANAALYCGAEVRFADVDPESFNVDLNEVGKLLDDKVKAVIPVDLAGEPVELAALRRLVGGDVTIIADSCHALGADYRDESGKWRKVGDCEYADMAVFSFHPAKNITSAEGGAVLTNSEELYSKLKLLQNNGITKEPGDWAYPEQGFTTDSEGRRQPDPWYYEMQDLGQNCRLTELQCALGLSQLEKLDYFIQHRRTLADFYRKHFTGSSIGFQKISADSRSGCHLFILQIAFEEHGTTRAELMAALRDAGIGTQVHYIPVHYQPYYRKLGFKPGMLPRAEAYYERALSIPLFADLKESEGEYVVKTLFRLLNI
jgi:UDP-4-amino-4,6-dideoxy-N-acetyl-beta-L-altrosamine transaminase